MVVVVVIVVVMVLLMFSVSSFAQNGIAGLGKAHTRSAPFHGILPKDAHETVYRQFNRYLNTDSSRPRKNRLLSTSFSTHLSLRRSVL